MAHRRANCALSATRRLDRETHTENHGSILEKIENLVGPDLTAVLLKEVGGRKVYIRVHPVEHAGDVITDAIGLAAAQMLGRAFGGTWVTLPAGRMLEWRRGRTERQTRILEMFDRGTHPGRIASALQCSERYVYKVLNGK